MNLVDVKVKQFSKAATRKDDHFGEPRNGALKAYGTPLSLRAQIVYAATDRRVQAMTGDPGESKGHLTFRMSDVSTITFHKGDIITEVAGVTTDYKVTEVQPSGHLRGRANLLLLFFGDNEENAPTFKR